MLLSVRFVSKMCLIMGLGSNGMYPGFARHILIRYRADIRKKCSILLYWLHLRSAADLISWLYMAGSSVFFTIS
jgi:hypothetical protein